MKLVPENDPILTLLTKPWNFENDGDPSELVDQMTLIMKANRGIGLAAPQVGIGKSIFLIDHGDHIEPYINPVLTRAEGEEIGEEGCLSFPNLWLKVKRYKGIEVSYKGIDGMGKSAFLTDLPARVFQHEFDHLKGVCFIEKVGSLSLTFARKKQKKLNLSNKRY